MFDFFDIRFLIVENQESRKKRGNGKHDGKYNKKYNLSK